MIRYLWRYCLTKNKTWNCLLKNEGSSVCARFVKSSPLFLSPLHDKYCVVVSSVRTTPPTLRTSSMVKQVQRERVRESPFSRTHTSTEVVIGQRSVRLCFNWLKTLFLPCSPKHDFFYFVLVLIMHPANVVISKRPCIKRETEVARYTHLLLL